MSLEVPGSSISDDTADDDGNSLRKSISTAEAGVLFMRLAGHKPTGLKGTDNIPPPIAPPAASNDTKKPGKSKSKGKEKKNGGRSSISDTKEGHKINDEASAPVGDENADWHEDMDENTLSTFRDLFNMLDQSNTGIITADNLYEELRRVDSQITINEVEDVLKKVDKDGNGEIDFDEFLFHMTNMGGEIEDGADEEKQRIYKKRKRMFYNAITRISIKQTLADIEKTFKKQAPHVISHYSAGVRLIGLTTRQLERQMKRMQKNVSRNDSPYAKPLQFVHMGAKTLVHKKKIIKKDIPCSSRDLRQEVEKAKEPSDSAVVDLSNEIKDTMKLFTEVGPEKGKFPDASILMKLRQKIGSVTAQLRSQDTSPITLQVDTVGNLATNEPSYDDQNTTLLTKPKSATFRLVHMNKKRSAQSKSTLSARVLNPKKKKFGGLGWTTPRIHYINVPLPSLKMKLTSEKPTFNDLYRIRAKAEEATDAYYHNLRQAEIRNAWDHWDRLYADVIVPKKLLDNFRIVYSAYSPHREEEAFVVCPWKPGPFRYIRHMPKSPTFSCPNSRDVASDRNSPRVKGTLDHLTITPKSTFGLMSRPPSRCSSRMS